MDNLKNIFIRYLIIVLIALPNLFLFYIIFTPLTIYPIYGLLRLFFENVLLLNNAFKIENFSIEIIKACIGGSAYYLLFTLNLSIPNIKLKKRLKMILFSFVFLLILNIIRIFVLSLIFISNNSSFDSIHKLFWYFSAVFFISFIWFAEVKIFKIKEIPLYSDVKYLVKKIKKSKSSQQD